MKKYSDAFTQGGQTELHKFHMMRQVFWTTSKISGVLAIFGFVFLLWNDHFWQDYYFLCAFYKALIRVNLSFLPKEFFDTSWIVIHKNQWIEIADHFLVADLRYQRFAAHLNAYILKSLLQSVGLFMASLLGISGFWIWRGKKRQETKFLKGFQLISPKALKKWVKKEDLSEIKINDIPLPFGAECQHMMITGTTGSGKSNAMHSLLVQIRELGQKAVIIDTTGELVSRFYKPETDHILNALDKRGRLWNVWKECSKKSDFEELAECLIPQNSSHEPIWTDGPRTLFSECAAMISEEKNPSIHKLLDVLLKMPLHQTADFLRGTLAASMADPRIEKGALSMRMILATTLKSFETLEDVGADFSIQEWIKSPNHPGFLFLSCLTDQRALMSPLLSIWLSISVKSLMKLQPDRDRRVWFMIDELGTLLRLPILLTALSEARKYGGCFVVGFQDIWQIEETYGRNITHSLAGLTGTKLVFRTSCNTTAERMSKALGEQVILEPSESISYGAHQMRDGVNLGGQLMEKPVVSGSDIMQLKNLHAYLKLPEQSGISEVEFPFLDLPRISSSCVEKSLHLNEPLEKHSVSELLSDLNESSDNDSLSHNKKVEEIGIESSEL